MIRFIDKKLFGFLLTFSELSAKLTRKNTLTKLCQMVEVEGNGRSLGFLTLNADRETNFK